MLSSFKRTPAIAALTALLVLPGCADMDYRTNNSTGARTLTGGAIGAGVGAVGTAVTGGCVWCGVAIGGAVGAASGFVYDQVQKDNGR